MVHGEVRFPWEKPKENEEQEGGFMRRSRTSLAELTLLESELKRLRNLTFQKKHKTRIGGGGVTQAVVDVIHERWKTSEIVRLKIEGPLALNMKRIHEILEQKTCGLVVWRSGTSLSLYRGMSYVVPSLKMNKRIYSRNEVPYSLQKVDDKYTGDFAKFASDRDADTSLEKPESIAKEKKGTVHQPETKYEDEVDKLLEGLGPRYTDWQDAIHYLEATALRRLVRFLPPHFALGLAVAMIKLWETSSIAKIALKHGVQLTTSERMAEELKQAQLRASAIIIPRNDVAKQSRTAGTLAETLDANAKWGTRLDDSERALSKVKEFLKPVNRPADPDNITDEERFMFLKLGLRMKAFLLLGRRRVFDGTVDGTVENIHLHWKYYELVKIVVNARTFDQVRKIALALEAENGSVLVSVDKISRKKFAIVVFRGKDYQRPKTLRPKNLLTKRKAWAILKHMSALQSKVDKLKSELVFSPHFSSLSFGDKGTDAKENVLVEFHKFIAFLKTYQSRKF
ncbi:hypothetical protein UlMin_020192 [Ulmus minor]